MEQNTLFKLRKIQLELLDEFVCICKANNLSYFLTAGTLIGAVRHNGYIPWDDDIDIAMSREDYEKFIDICEVKDETNYYILSNRSPGNYKLDYRSYAKFCKKGTVYAENIKNNDCYPGIFIDIWPYDKSFYPFIPIQRELIIFIWDLYCRLKRNIDKKQKDYKNILARIFCIIIPIKIIDIMHKKLYVIFNKSKAKSISFFSGRYNYKRESHKYNILFPLLKMEFEGKHYCVPNNWDLFLKKMYGNYMELPPVEKQVSHHFSNYITFNDSE